MDDTTLSSLEAALQASPDNVPLLAVLLRGHADRGHFDRAATLLGPRTPADFAADADRTTAARVLLGANQPERALAFATAGDAPTLLLKAKICARLGRMEDGRNAYDAALAANPTLEDPELRASLDTRVREVEPAGKGGPRLRVIANDDTAAAEAKTLLAPEQPPITFADVGGLTEVKEQIHRRIVLPFQKPTLFDRFKRRAGGGILLYGPPGCGKTMLARATAGECKATFLAVAISDILDMYIGESEKKLAAIFEKARQSTPSVLFFDELEALAGKRQFSRDGLASKLVSQFLAEMDGFAQNNKGVLVLGATNVPWAVDAAFRRPGRFDRVQFIPPPDQKAREEILRLHLAGRPVAEGIDVAALAKATSGFTGADLSQVVETAADFAIERSLESSSESAIESRDLHAAVKDVKPTAIEWLTTARNYAKYANESGQYDEVLRFLEKHGKA